MRLFVPLTKPEFDSLRELAHIERRRPQDQAAMILVRVLAGEPTSPRPGHDTLTDQTPQPSPEEAQRATA